MNDTSIAFDRLAAAHAAMQLQPHAFPWNSLVEELLTQGIEKIRILGYGSFLCPTSTRRTVPSAPEEGFPPVLGLGAKRVFNYTMPDGLLARYNSQEGPREKAALNVVTEGQAGHFITGRLMEVPFQDLPAMRVREKGYHLDPVPFLPWGNSGATIEYAFLFRADETPVDGVCHVDNSLLPHPGYTDLCINGAGTVDDAFKRLFLETSYLADGSTSLDQHLAEKAALA